MATAPKIAKDVRDYVAGLAGFSTDTVNVGMFAPTPIKQYCVFEYPGPANIKTHGGGNPVLWNARLQIAARDTTAAAALTNIHKAVDALDGLKDTVINTNFIYLYFWEIARPRIIQTQQSEPGSVMYAWDFATECRAAV